MTDTSDTGVDAVVEEELNSLQESIAFISVKISPAQTRYNTFENF